MAVNKRAAMRREKRVQEKLTGGKPTQTKLMARAYITGKNEGFELATEEFGFGNKRINRLIERISDESVKMDEDPTKFNVDWYIDKVREKCGVRILKSDEDE